MLWKGKNIKWIMYTVGLEDDCYDLFLFYLHYFIVLVEEGGELGRAEG